MRIPPHICSYVEYETTKKQNRTKQKKKKKKRKKEKKMGLAKSGP